ncbi:MAG: histidine phosphatase family protein [Alphaproteobacteria bacterium]|nr:histidine phosphatase family protein [Alphaproteobacteria bacterium]
MTRIVPLLGIDRLTALARAEPVELDLASFLFLRHGETDGNLRSIYQRPDQPLNATGEAQAARAATLLARQRVVDVVASPMARAWRTATVAAEPHGLAPRPEPGIQERVYTALFGQPNSDFDWALDPPGCESLEAFVARVRTGLARALGAPPPATGQRLVVAHGGVLLVLAAMVGVDLPPELHRNATPLMFERQAGAWAARGIAATT